MRCNDEEILQTRQSIKEMQHQSLETGIYVNGKLIEFKSLTLLDNKLDIIFPKDFIDMPDEVVEVKYPSIYRPSIIKTSLDGEVNFTFQLYNTTVNSEDDINDIVEQFRTVLLHVNPSIKTIKVDEEKNENQYFKMMSYKSTTIDDQIFNIMCYTSVEHKVLQETFNCLYDENEKWVSLAKKVLLSAKEHFL